MSDLNLQIPSSRDLRLEDLSRKLRPGNKPPGGPGRFEPSLSTGKNPGPLSNPAQAEKPLAEEIRKYFPGLDQGTMASERFRLDRMPDPHTLTGEKKRLYETAQEFQSLFINMMLKGMRATLHHEDDMLYGGRTQEIFEDMLYDEYSKSYSKTAGFPLAEQIYLQMAPLVNEKAGDSYEQNLKKLPPSVSTDQIHREWKR